MRTIYEWTDRLERITDDTRHDKTLDWGIFAVLMTIALILVDILQELKAWKK